MSDLESCPSGTMNAIRELREQLEKADAVIRYYAEPTNWRDKKDSVQAWMTKYRAYFEEKRKGECK